MGQTLLFFLLDNLFHSTYVLFCQEWFLRLPRVLGRHRGVLSCRACVVILICCCVMSFCLFCAFVFCHRFLMFCISILICFVSCGSSALPVVLVISLSAVFAGLFRVVIRGGSPFGAVGVSRSFIILFSASWWWTFPRLLLFPLFRCLSPRWLVPAGWWGVSSVLLALVCWWWFFSWMIGGIWVLVSGF